MSLFNTGIISSSDGKYKSLRYFYVSSSYTGATANGGLTTPWKTLAQVQSAMSSFQAGDAILFKCGDTFSGTLNITRSGTASNPIIFGSYGEGLRPKLIGTGSVIPYLIYLFGRSYVIFDNLWITDPTMSPTDRTIDAKIQRAFTFDESSYCTISNCTIELIGVAGYFTGPNNSMLSNYITNLRMVVDTDDGGPIGSGGNDDDYGANALVVSSSDNTFSYNVVDGLWADSYDYLYDGGAIDIFADLGDITGNTFSYNIFHDCNGICEIAGRGTSIVSETLFAYNLLINNGSVSYVSNQSPFLSDCNNLKFYNNIFIESQPYRLPETSLFGFNLAPTTPNTLDLRNNVFQIYGTVDICRNQFTTTTLTHLNNVYKLGSGSVLNFTANPSEILTSGTIFANTTGAPLTWNFHPSAGSVLINNGINVGLDVDFDGHTLTPTPYIGIYNY